MEDMYKTIMTDEEGNWSSDGIKWTKNDFIFCPPSSSNVQLEIVHNCILILKSTFDDPKEYELVGDRGGLDIPQDFPLNSKSGIYCLPETLAHFDSTEKKMSKVVLYNYGLVDYSMCCLKNAVKKEDCGSDYVSVYDGEISFTK